MIKQNGKNQRSEADGFKETDENNENHEVLSKNHVKYKIEMIGSTIMAIIGFILIRLLNNPYPCSATGIGCHSVIQMITDSLDFYLGVPLAFAGIGCLIYFGTKSCNHR